jgi:hypothetical protein
VTKSTAREFASQRRVIVWPPHGLHDLRGHRCRRTAKLERASAGQFVWLAWQRIVAEKREAAKRCETMDAGALDCVGFMCGRRPRCKKNLTCSLRSGASHVSGLFARHHDRWP